MPVKKFIPFLIVLFLSAASYADYLGLWVIDDYLTFTVNTHSPTTGAATDADTEPNYRVYEDETYTAILTGSFALLNTNSTTGFYSERILLSAANGFEVGKSYHIYCSATVGTIVGTKCDNFQITSNMSQSGDSYARLGTPAGASVVADINSIGLKTKYLPSATAGATGGVAIVGSSMSFAMSGSDITSLANQIAAKLYIYGKNPDGSGFTITNWAFLGKDYFEGFYE